tara:strand:+ start:1418 stop:1831 length:414 start_codon:yes stop_codon:yes gene_type:complete
MSDEGKGQRADLTMLGLDFGRMIHGYVQLPLKKRAELMPRIQEFLDDLVKGGFLVDSETSGHHWDIESLDLAVLDPWRFSSLPLAFGFWCGLDIPKGAVIVHRVEPRVMLLDAIRAAAAEGEIPGWMIALRAKIDSQ